MSQILDFVVGTRTPITIVSSSSGMVLDVQAPVPIPGVPIVLNPQSGGPSQLWRIVPTDDDVFTIVPAQRGPIPIPVALGAARWLGGSRGPDRSGPPVGGAESALAVRACGR